MKLFPYANLNFKTRLSTQDVQKRLSEIVEPWQFMRNPFDNQHKPYQGEVNEDDFSVSLIARQSRKYKLMAKGKYQHEFGGCIVNVKVRFSFYTYLMMLFLFAIFLVTLFIELVQPFLESNSLSTVSMSNLTTIGIIGVVVFINYISSLSVYLKFLNRVKKDFCSLFETENVEELGFEWVRDRGFE